MDGPLSRIALLSVIKNVLFLLQGNKYHDVSSSESFDIFVEDVLDFFWQCLEDKKKSLSTSIGHDKIKLYRHKPKPWANTFKDLWHMLVVGEQKACE